MKTYKFYIIRARIRYPVNKRFKSNEDFMQYINSKVNSNNIVRLNESSDFDKVYNFFQLIKEPPKNKIVDKGQTQIETHIYYMVQCRYINNKLQSHLILSCKQPQYMSNKTAI